MTMPDGFDAKEFIVAQTAIAAPAFVPEIKLYLATEVTPLWQMTEEQLGETNLPPPFWAFAWPGGQALARHIIDHPEIVRGKRVLDFAAGCGIASIAALRAGATRVMAAEIDPLAEAATDMNAALNGVRAENIGPVKLDKAFKGVDVILAGDVCYQQAMSVAVTRWLRLCVQAGIRVLMADPGRAWVPEEGLIEIARYTVPTSLELEDTEERNVVLWELVIVR